MARQFDLEPHPVESGKSLDTGDPKRGELPPDRASESVVSPREEGGRVAVPPPAGGTGVISSGPFEISPHSLAGVAASNPPPPPLSERSRRPNGMPIGTLVVIAAAVLFLLVGLSLLLFV